jgi:hypothetical protein
MYSKLFILALVASVSVGQLAIPKRAWGGGLIGNRAIGAIGGYGNLGLVRAAAPVAVGTGVTLSNIGTLGYNDHAFLGGLGLHRGVYTGYAPYTGPVSAAIETYRTHQVIDVPTSQEVIAPSTLIVEPNVMPVNIEFRSQSSPVNVDQVHIPGRPGIVKETQSEEEADILRHEVIKPVVQEVRETIVPFRRITQEILPVQEQVHTLVAQGQRQQVLAGVVEKAVVAAPAIAAVAAPAVSVVEAPVGVVGGIVAEPAGGLITTGINRLAGPLYAKELIKARSRAA